MIFDNCDIFVPLKHSNGGGESIASNIIFLIAYIIPPLSRFDTFKIRVLQ
jgi:hypothetical protein